MQRKELTEEMTIVFTFKAIAMAYEQISVLKIQEVRNSVLRSRVFLEGLSQVFFNVKNSYKNQIIALMKKSGRAGSTRVSRFSTLAKNGKSVTVMLSANTKLYGDIVPKTFSLFIEDIKKNDSDIVIVGKLGKNLFDTAGLSRPYEYFELDDSKVTFGDLTPIMSYILNYEKVSVFYGKFVNVVQQKAEQTTISGEDPVSKIKTQEELKFLFEPTLEKILNFFETQISTTLFQQTVHESQLARHASRIRAMEEALNNINTRMKLFEIQSKRIKQSVANKKQLETFSGMALWSK